MDNFEHSREKNINDIISVVKLAALLFCAIIVYNRILVKDKVITSTMADNFSIVVFSVITGVIIVIYWIWAFLSTNKTLSKYNKKIQIVENFMFILIFSILIVRSDAHLSQYKFLFLFIIITSTLQLGMKYGMATAIVSSTVILMIDLMYGPKGPINMYFENDLILAGVFILTAWPLGYYVKIEKDRKSVV